MPRAKKGNQKPTQSLILPYKTTHAKKAIDLYQSTGRTAQRWQKNLLKDIMAVNSDGLWMHTKFGYSVSRRNGKNEIVAMREMAGLKTGERILHTAHRTTTTHTAWERLSDLLEKAKIPITSSYRAYGKEHIEIEGGGKAEFRTRTSKGGLGEGFDLLIIDEAQEYQDDHESALKYVVSDSPNPQTIFCGTPPTPVSSGTVFMKLRQSALAGTSVNTGWSEWSVEEFTDPHDKKAWYLTNPSMGTILTERKIQDEIGGDDIDFNIQRLGLWIKYNQKSAIGRNEWLNLKAEVLPKLTGKLFVGIKYGHNGNNVSMSIAAKTEEDKIFVETIDCQSVRNGNAWIIDFLKSADIAKVAVDGANGQMILAEEMKDVGLKRPVLPTVKEIIIAGSMFEKGIFGETIVHMGQESLVNAASNCEKRAIGSNGGFGYRSLRDDIDISILDSVIIAHWLASIHKPKKKQRISY